MKILKRKPSKICPGCEKRFFRYCSTSNWNKQIYCSSSCFGASKIKINIHQYIKDNSLLVSSGCIEWQLYCNKGYGQLTHLMKRYYAHRLVWTLEKGEIPEGLLVCHHCDNRKCVNTDHLFLGTHQDNMDDMVKKGRSKNKNILDHKLILKLIKKEFYSYIEIAEQFNCSSSLISLIALKNGIHKNSRRSSKC